MSDFRLQVFVKVAKRLNLTQVAQELGISQPAVSKHMQELELQYNTQLIDRSGGRIGLTPAGRLFYIHAERILDAYGALEAEMYRISDNYCGEIRVSADRPVVDDALFQTLLSFCNNYPCIKLSYIDRSGHSSISLLQDGTIDMAFTNGPYLKDDLLYTPYSEQKWVFIAYARGIFARTSKVTLDEIVDYKLNINIFKSNREFDYNSLLHHNRFITQFADVEKIKYLMFKNDSIGLLPLYAVEREIADGDLKVIDVDGLVFDEEVGILTRHDDTNHAIQWFLDFVRDYNI